MILKRFGIILFLIFSLLPINKVIAQTTNAGFVPGNIWYSKDPFAEGDKIKIYTLIFNPDTRKFSGTIDFFDKDVLLGTKDFNVAGTSTKDVSINWNVTVGDHSIFAEIKNAKFLMSNGQYQNISLTENKTETSSRTVNKKIIPPVGDNTKTEAENISNSLLSTFNGAVNSIQNIGSGAKNVIPTFISQPITNTMDGVDGLRNNISTTLGKAQDDTENKINVLNNLKKEPKDPSNENVIQKPLEYVALFFLFILKTIFEYKILFYGIIALIIFFILRYLWDLFL